MHSRESLQCITDRWNSGGASAWEIHHSLCLTANSLCCFGQGLLKYLWMEKLLGSSIHGFHIYSHPWFWHWGPFSFSPSQLFLFYFHFGCSWCLLPQNVWWESNIEHPSPLRNYDEKKKEKVWPYQAKGKISNYLLKSQYLHSKTRFNLEGISPQNLLEEF